ncbi:DedA family protein [Streptodolium elevatio]|uniref:VTT domain-containing protein n=1 Tax=Streptodolium elevatio TaxID=3157996 RepID=A0ABV3DLN9_9ACTN
MTAAGTGLLFSPWLWLVLPLTVCADSVVPVIPGDELVMASSAVGRGNFGYLALVLLLAVVGAFVGDQCAYAVGRAGLRRGGDMTLGPRRQKAFDLAERALNRGGMAALVAARFLPGGRTAVNILAGRVGYPPRQFRAATLVGAGISVSYALTLGALAGKYVHDSPLFVAVCGMLLGASVPLLVGIPARIVKVVRRRRGVAAQEEVAAEAGAEAG